MDNGVLRKTALNQLLVGEKKRMLIRTRTDPPPPNGFNTHIFGSKALHSIWVVVDIARFTGVWVTNSCRRVSLCI